MGRKPKYTPQEAEAIGRTEVDLGKALHSGYVHAGNRRAVIQWLTAQGNPSAAVNRMTLAQLGVSWHDATGQKGRDIVASIVRANPDLSRDDEAEDDDMPEPAPAARANTDRVSAITAAITAALADQPSIDEATVAAMIDKRISEATLPRPLSIIVNDVKKGDVPAGHHKCFEMLLRRVANNLNPLIVGPAGAGKTHAVKQVCDALSIEFRGIGSISGAHEILGYRDARGEYVSTDFRYAYERGCLFLMDELDGCDPQALLPINSLDNGYLAFPDANVKRHPDFRLVATANTFGRGQDRVYVGRNQLDASTLNRFSVISWDYDETLERVIAANLDWTLYVQKVRSAVFRLGLRHVVSPRASIRGGILLAAGEERPSVEASEIWCGLSAEDIKRVRDAM